MPTTPARRFTSLFNRSSGFVECSLVLCCGGNTRTHSPSQVTQISASIAEFGFVNPVLVDADDVLIAGHGRVIPRRNRHDQTSCAAQFGWEIHTS